MRRFSSAARRCWANGRVVRTKGGSKDKRHSDEGTADSSFGAALGPAGLPTEGPNRAQQCFQRRFLPQKLRKFHRRASAVLVLLLPIGLVFCHKGMRRRAVGHDHAPTLPSSAPRICGCRARCLFLLWHASKLEMLQSDSDYQTRVPRTHTHATRCSSRRRKETADVQPRRCGRETGASRKRRGFPAQLLTDAKSRASFFSLPEQQL